MQNNAYLLSHSRDLSSWQGGEEVGQGGGGLRDSRSEAQVISGNNSAAGN